MFWSGLILDRGLIVFYDDAMNSGVVDPRSRGNLAPWSSPSYIPGRPHNLPLQAPQGNLGAGAGSTTQQAPGSSNPVAVSDAYRYASLVDLNIVVGTDSVKFLDQPIGKRNFLLLRNAGAAAIYIGFGGAASVNSTVQLAAGALLLFDTVVPQDDLYVAGAGASVLCYAYSTFPG